MASRLHGASNKPLNWIQYLSAKCNQELDKIVSNNSQEGVYVCVSELDFHALPETEGKGRFPMFNTCSEPVQVCSRLTGFFLLKQPNHLLMYSHSDTFKTNKYPFYKHHTKNTTRHVSYWITKITKMYQMYRILVPYLKRRLPHVEHYCFEWIT